MEDVQQPGRILEENGISKEGNPTNREGYQNMKNIMVSWKIEELNGVRKQP
jgi:hypothetical protein